MFDFYKSDATLDAEYNAARLAGDTVRASDLQGTIIQRLTSVFGFLGATVSGASDFPLYEQWTGFNAGKAARDSVTVSAGNVASTVGSGVSAVGNYLKTPLFIAGAFALAALFVYGYAKSRK